MAAAEETAAVREIVAAEDSPAGGGRARKLRIDAAGGSAAAGGLGDEALDQNLQAIGAKMGNRGARIRKLASSLAAGGLVAGLGLGILIKHRHSTELSPEGPAAGTSRAGSGRPDKHEAILLAEVLKKKPDHTPVLMRLAQLAEGSGDRAEAARLLARVVQNEPDNAEARLELGRLLFESGDVAGAIEHTKRILARQPRHVDALYNLGAIYANIGNVKLAREYWNRAIQTGPRSESSAKARTMLAKLNSESL